MASPGIHLLVGAALGKRCGSISGTAAVGSISHAVLDVVPHYDYKSPILLGADLAGAGTILRLACRRGSNFDTAIVGAAAAMFPDVEHALHQLGLVQQSSYSPPTTGFSSMGADRRRKLLYFMQPSEASAYGSCCESRTKSAT